MGKIDYQDYVARKIFSRNPGHSLRAKFSSKSMSQVKPQFSLSHSRHASEIFSIGAPKKQSD